jgi:uncharacterized membrane protein (DUF2068 family)
VLFRSCFRRSAELAVTTPTRKRHAPTYYAIITIKTVKGLFFVALAMGVFSLIRDDLPAELDRALRWAHLDPETAVFIQFARWLATITPENVRWVASGTLLYGLLSLGEGLGLMLRSPWVGWLVICESALLIPYEVYHLLLGFSTVVSGILLLNVGIVWYLVQNRRWLFRYHHGHRESRTVPAPSTLVADNAGGVRTLS